jgi:5-methylcytosine-specific restriction endonuclease McrA
MANEKIALVYSFVEFSAVFPDILKSKHHMTRDCTIGKTVQVCCKSFSTVSRQWSFTATMGYIWDLALLCLQCFGYN